MIDKNGREIKSGKFVRYEGGIFKVLHARMDKIVLFGGEKSEVLHVHPDCLRDKILNLEVIGSFPMGR